MKMDSIRCHLRPQGDPQMSYNYDPELQALLAFLPDTSLGIHDPVKARAG